MSGTVVVNSGLNSQGLGNIDYSNTEAKTKKQSYHRRN